MIKKIKIDLLSPRIKSKQLSEKRFYKLFMKTMMDFDPSKDYYKILGLDQNSTEKQIKESYFKLAKKHHPDVNNGKTTEMFKEMTNAYDILSDKNKKKQYDEYRGMFKNQSTQHQNPYYNSQAGHSNYNYDNTEYGKTSGNYKTRTTYSYRDPKTGEYKSHTYEGDFKGNPFFKDFEEFFKKTSSNTNFNQDNTQRNFRGRAGGNFNNFNNFNDFHDPYSQRGNFDPNKQKNERFNWNPQHNQWDYDYLNYLYAKRIFKLLFIGTTFIFLIAMIQGRNRQRHYDEMMMLQQPYVTLTPYPPNGNVPPGGAPNQYTPPYPPNVMPPAYNKNDIRYVNDPYVNPYAEPKLR